MKKSLSIFMIVGLLAAAAAPAVRAEDKPVYHEFADEASDRYHAYPPTCKPGKKNLDFSKDHQIFFKDAKEAEAKGLVPCKLCHRVASSGNFNSSS
jgi:hypothetical protein